MSGIWVAVKAATRTSARSRNTHVEVVEVAPRGAHDDDGLVPAAHCACSSLARSQQVSNTVTSPPPPRRALPAEGREEELGRQHLLAAAEGEEPCG